MRSLKNLPKTDAQDRIISAIVAAALQAHEAGDENLEAAIQILGAKLAKSYGVSDVPGLPDTRSA